MLFMIQDTTRKSMEAQYLKKLIEHFSLSAEESKELMQKFISGSYEPKIAASLMSILSFKGETPEELTGFAVALREGMKKFNTQYTDVIDIVETSGINSNIFNISTISSIL